ncbi:hypothetical protein M9H77_29533 [Catharanthus roseus]|uniref:Uncharacterized protein n=1 Tax=Catharanthus roseus TaxID=4058 RepID=A0ACB9ZV16_CATRO|nr:hypothetical protein M9H77_29533 [Catharanthus roseus]
MEVREEISRIDALFYTTRQAHRQAAARAAMLERELAQMRRLRVVGSQSPNHADEAISESFQNRQSEPIREATPRLEQATHKVIENFMIKMTELLETSMATRRNERVPAIGADEALERFLKFRPPEFYGEVEHEIKAELFLEQLNDIYDTLKYEDALRVTIGGLELPKLGHLRINHGLGTIFKKNSKKNTYLVRFLSNEMMSFSN